MTVSEGSQTGQVAAIEGPARILLDLLVEAAANGTGHAKGDGLSYTELQKLSRLEPEALIRALAWMNHRGYVRRYKVKGRRIAALRPAAEVQS